MAALGTGAVLLGTVETRVAAFADSVNIQPFQPPSGFWIGSPHRKTDGGDTVLYGPTSANANWMVLPWSNPAELPGFVRTPAVNSQQAGVPTLQNLNQRGDGGLPSPPVAPLPPLPFVDSWTATLPNVTTTVVQQPDGTFTATLSQTADSPQACTNGELDLFLQPNSTDFNNQAPSAVLPGDALPSLDMLQSARIWGDFRVVSTGIPRDIAPCVVNQTQAGLALILSNATAGQTLFYQIEFLGICLPNAPDWCTDNTPGYFAPGVTPVFGYNDYLPTYNMALINDSFTHRIYVDVLPVLTALIQRSTTARNRLDPDISHWKITSEYFGQSIWGQVALQTRWHGFVPVETTWP